MTERARTLLLLALLVGAAFAVRLMPLEQVVREDGVRFYDSDSFYHLRRIDFCLEHFPRVPIHDPYSNYPHGGVTMWPPLNDAAMAGIALALDGPEPSRRVVERVAAFFPSVVGALTVPAMYLLGLRLAGRRQGLTAAALLAIQPAHVLYSAVGRPDQHVTEVLGATLLFASVLSLPSLRGDAAALSRRHAWGWAIVGALAGAVSILVWMGALLFQGIVVAFAAAVAIWRAVRRDRPISPFAREILTLLSLEAAIVCAATAYLLVGMETTPTYVSFSWFQAHFCVLSTLALAIFLALVSARVDGAADTTRAVRGPLGVTALLAALMVPTGLAGTVTTTSRGLRHITKTSELIHAEDASTHVLSYNKLWLRVIHEYNPLLYPRGEFDPGSWAMSYVGPVLFVAPLLLVFYLVRREDAAPRDARLLVPIWMGAFALMALSQVKYVYLLSTVACFFVADLLVAMMRLPAGVVRATAVTLVAAAMWGSGLLYLARFNASYHDLEEHLRESLLVLREITPEPGDYTASEGVPDYGVFAFWDLGNYMQYLSQRPVVANNNGYGFEDTIELYFAKTEAEADAVLERRGVRYLVLTPRVASLATIWEEMTGSLAPYFRSPDGRHLTVMPPYLDLVYPRLYFADGQAFDGSAPVLDGFRLIYEQPGPARRLMSVPPADAPVAPVKIYERVAGATLVGEGFLPGEVVTLETTVRTNLERDFVDRREATADDDGTFRIRVPYGAAADLPVRPTSWTLVRGDGERASLTVPEQAVVDGGTVTVRARSEDDDAPDPGFTETPGGS